MISQIGKKFGALHFLNQENWLVALSCYNSTKLFNSDSTVDVLSMHFVRFGKWFEFESGFILFPLGIGESAFSFCV